MHEMIAGTPQAFSPRDLEGIAAASTSPAHILRILAGKLAGQAWPLSWDQVSPVAVKVASHILPEATQELLIVIQTEIVSLGPRYRPFSNHGIDAYGACGRSPGALSKSRATGLYPDEFAELYCRVLRRLGEGFAHRSEEVRMGKVLTQDCVANLTEKFRLLGKTLRVGRLGVVRLCEPRTIDTETPPQLYVTRSVSVEVMNLSHRGRPAGRVSDDLKILLGLDHPHVACLRQALEDDACLHLVFEHVEGVDLHTALRHSIKTGGRNTRTYARHAISESWIAALTHQLVLAIGYCHWQRVVHRNITLRKIMLRGWASWSSGVSAITSVGVVLAAAPAPPPHVVLLDAGLAETLVPAHIGGAAAAERSQIGKVERPYGTPYFMAPEVFRCEYGPGCDVWSLGIVTFALLAGHFPFEADGGDAAAIEDLVTGHARPSTPPPHVSADAMAFCTELLRKDDACRPRAMEIADASWFSVARDRFGVLPPDLYKVIVDLC